jgi:WD40 repeat protein/serine/threonine protein kinase
MTASRPDNEAIFHAARAIPDQDRRREYVRQACAGDEVRIAHVEALLAVAEGPDSLLDYPAADIPTTGLPTTESPGTVIGPYKLIEQIGEGGMGSVWMAQQTKPVQRLVAVKLIKAGMDTRQVIARFEAERQALALMDHPNIARVLDGGTTKGEPGGVSPGRPYFVMDLVKGVPITRYCDEHHLTPRQRLELFIPVCQAIQHAHQKGIIHRDLKPNNVLVAPYDGKAVVKVIDFGVAKAAGQQLTDRTLVTGFGAVVGTLEYMSPEQAELNNHDIDTRSDIYALGVLLYELLAGSPPFSRKELEQAGMVEMLRVIREQEPSKPSTKLSSSDALPTLSANRGTEPAKLAKLVRGELDWIVMKALEKDRSRRYETANGFAADVSRYLAGEPVLAHPPSTAYRFRKFARKYRTPLCVAGAFLLLLVVGVVISVWQAVRATAAEGVAEERKREADGAKQQAEKRGEELAELNGTLRRAKYIADMNLAHHAWAENNLIRTRELLDLHRPGPGETDLRGFEWHYLNRLFHGELHIWQAHPGNVTAIAFTSNGKRLFSCGRTQTRQSMSVSDARQAPREIKLWDVATGRQLPLRLKEPTDKVWHLAVNPDGTRLAAACGDQGIRLWDLTTGEQSTLPRHEQERDVYVGFSPDGKRLVAASLPDRDAPEVDCLTARVWDLAGPWVVMTVEKLQRFRKDIGFSPDGKLLAFADTPRDRVQVFDAVTGREAFTCKYADGRVWHAVFSPDGKRLATCVNGGVQFWDVGTHEAVATWPIASITCDFLAYSPDGKRLAVATVEGAVQLWDTATKQRVNTFNGHSGYLYMVAFSPDGTQLASAGSDGTVRLWDPTGRREMVPLTRSAPDINHLDLGPDGKALLAYVPGKTIQFWDAATGEPRGDPIDKPGWWGGMSSCWTADGKRVFAIDGLKHIQVLDAAAGKVVRTLEVDAEGLGAVAVSPDGKWCAHAAPGGAVKVRDVVTGAESQIQGFDNQVYYLVFSPDGSHLLGMDSSSQLKIWDRATGRKLAATRLSDVYVQCVRYSADGKRLAVVGLQHQSGVGEIRVLDAETGRELAALKGHVLTVGDADFSPDGQRLATCSQDKTVRLWDLASGQEILTLRGHTRGVNSVRFVSGGNRLISASADRTVRIWDATPLPE